MEEKEVNSSESKEVGISAFLLVVAMILPFALVTVPFIVSVTPLAQNKEIMAGYGLFGLVGGLLASYWWFRIVWSETGERRQTITDSIARLFSGPTRRTAESDLSPEEVVKQVKEEEKKWDLRNVDSWTDEDADKFWRELKTTDEIKVSNKLRDWVIFQDEVTWKIKIFLLNFIDTMKYIKSEVKAGKNLSEVLSKRPAPKVLLLGEPGDGKSLICKATREDLDDLFRQEGATDIFDDVLCVQRKHLSSRPGIVTCPAGVAKPYLKQREKRLKRKQTSIKTPAKYLLGSTAFVGVILTTFFLVRMIMDIVINPLLFLNIMAAYAMPMQLGTSMILSSVFAYYILMALLGGALFSSTKKDEIAELPKILVDNSKKKVPFVDVTGATAANLFGEVTWNPVGALGDPAHKRMIPGAIHIAHGGILALDEIKNLTFEDGVTLLTVLEDGELSIKSRGGGRTGSGGGLDAESDPLRAMFFLLACGNLDIINDPESIINKLPALKDRFDGHGAIIFMNKTVPATSKNKAKVAQFVAQEVFRLGLPPMDASGIQRVISYLIRLSGKNNISTRLRLGMGLVKKAGLLAREEKAKVVTAIHVDRAEDTFAPAQQKVVQEEVEDRRRGKILLTEGGRVGRVNGLVVIGDQITGVQVGDVVVVTAFIEKVTDIKKADFIISGIEGEHPQWISDSINIVRTTILRKYGVDIAKEYYTHISFAQSRGIDGPSAGITMALAVASILGDPEQFRRTKEMKPIKIRQDTAITGGLENIEEGGKVAVSRVGGIPEKCRGAQENGIKRVIMPNINFELLSEEEKKRLKIEIDHAASFEEYLQKMIHREEGE